MVPFSNINSFLIEFNVSLFSWFNALTNSPSSKEVIKGKISMENCSVVGWFKVYLIKYLINADALWSVTIVKITSLMFSLKWSFASTATSSVFYRFKFSTHQFILKTVSALTLLLLITSEESSVKKMPSKVNIWLLFSL
mgnify:CR=1 FL=1